LGPFLDYAARTRANPKFDLEERSHRLEIAERLRGLLDATRGGSLLLQPSVNTVFRGQFGSRPYSLTIDHQNQWLKDWAAADEESLAEALIEFGRGDAETRFASFARIAQEAKAAGKIEVEAELVLAFGSLLNFAVEPGSLPVIRAALFTRLMRIVGYELKPEGSVSDRYEHYLAFARWIQTQMQNHGIPVRDMVDTQSLIWIAAADRDLWASEPGASGTPTKRLSETPAERDGRKRTRPYLAISAIYKDEAPYLQEWVEFHRLVGVERFFLYDNRSQDEHLEVLEPYVEDGTVVLHDWPVVPGQLPAHEHCLQEHRRDTRWIAFIDVDEFLFSPTYKLLPEVLSELEPWPGVGVNNALFGSSGHLTKPPGLVIENYLVADLEGDRLINSIVDPARTVRPESTHHFSYSEGRAVDENGYVIAHHMKGYCTRSVSHSRLRINHYRSKSEEELRAKIATPNAATGDFRPWPDLHLERRGYWEYDDTILRYVPALHKAIAETAARRSGIASRGIGL
jgi:hypothetical protein